MASPESYLSIDDFNDVAIACSPVASQWDELAKHLGIDRPTVEGIHRASLGQTTTWCLDQLMAYWLRQSSTLTWGTLCDAVAKLDVPLSEQIRRDHMPHAERHGLHSASDTRNTTPQQGSHRHSTKVYLRVLMQYKAKLVDYVYNPIKLAHELESALLIPQGTAEEIRTTVGIDQYGRASIVINEVLKVFWEDANDSEDKFKKFCQALKRLGNPIMDKLTDEMMINVGISMID